MLCFTYWGISEFAFRWILSDCAGGGRGGEWGPPTEEEARPVVVLVVMAVGVVIAAVIKCGRRGHVDPLPLPFPDRTVKNSGRR